MVRNYEKLAESVLRTMQPWGTGVQQFHDAFNVEDEDLLERFWQNVLGGGFNEAELKQWALLLYSSLLGVKTKPNFLAVQQAVSLPCRHMADVAKFLLSATDLELRPPCQTHIHGAGVRLSIGHR